MILHIKVVPNGSRNQVVGKMTDGSIKIKVQAPPEDGKANAAVIDVLATFFDCSKKQISILRGDTSRDKQIEVLNVSEENLIQKLSSLPLK